jgi:hypothetical protein
MISPDQPFQTRVIQRLCFLREITNHSLSSAAWEMYLPGSDGYYYMLFECQLRVFLQLYHIDNAPVFQVLFASPIQVFMFRTAAGAQSVTEKPMFHSLTPLVFA